MKKSSIQEVSHGGKGRQSQVCDNPAVERHVDVVVELAGLESLREIKFGHDDAQHNQVEDGQNDADGLVGSKSRTLYNWEDIRIDPVCISCTRNCVPDVKEGLVIELTVGSAGILGHESKAYSGCSWELVVFKEELLGCVGVPVFEEAARYRKEIKVEDQDVDEQSDAAFEDHSERFAPMFLYLPQFPALLPQIIQHFFTVLWGFNWQLLLLLLFHLFAVFCLNWSLCNPSFVSVVLHLFSSCRRKSISTLHQHLTTQVDLLTEMPKIVVWFLEVFSIITVALVLALFLAILLASHPFL